MNENDDDDVSSTSEENDPFTPKSHLAEAKADLILLDRILDRRNDPELTPTERRAFHDMRCAIRAGDLSRLTSKQASWAREVDARLKPIDLRMVPPLTGRVATMPVLAAPLPKRPPGRA